MRTRTKILLSLSACCGLLGWRCSATVPQVADVIDLAPPQHVTVEKLDDSIRLTWRPSIHESAPTFQGYDIYIGEKSLVLAPLRTLPQPVQVAKGTHALILDASHLPAEAFIHLRSRDVKGHLSLPSLPEIVLKNTAAAPQDLRW